MAAYVWRIPPLGGGVGGNQGGLDHVYAECNACCNKSQSPNCPLQPSVEFLEMSHVFKDSLSPLGISLQLFKTTNWDPAENSGRKCSLKTSNFTHMIATSGAYMIASGTETSKPTIQHQASCICNHPCFARHQKSSCLCLLQVNCFPTFGFSWIVKKKWVLFWGTPYEHSRCMSSNVYCITYVAHVHNNMTIDRDCDLKKYSKKRTTALCVACQMWSISNAAGEL